MDNLDLERPCTLFLEGPIGPDGKWIAVPRYSGSLRGILQNLVCHARSSLSDTLYVESDDGEFRISGSQIAAWAPAGDRRRDVLGEEYNGISEPLVRSPHQPIRARTHA